jgi:hypothetical protein
MVEQLTSFWVTMVMSKDPHTTIEIHRVWSLQNKFTLQSPGASLFLGGMVWYGHSNKFTLQSPGGMVWYGMVWSQGMVCMVWSQGMVWYHTIPYL